MPRSKRRVSQDILDKFVIKNSDLKDCNGFESAFSVVRPLAIDVGCGNGDFLYPYALSRPDMNVLGIEIQWKRICKASRKLFQHKTNIQKDNLLRLQQTNTDIYLRLKDQNPAKGYHPY